jgi:hypothetical protein
MVARAGLQYACDFITGDKALSIFNACCRGFHAVKRILFNQLPPTHGKEE